ncbi:MAG: hypothetical protein AAFV49_12775, partial [Pseudomonadota bacterium]
PQDALPALLSDGHHRILDGDIPAFRLDNASSQDFVLRGARSSVAGSAIIMMRMPVVGPMEPDQVIVPRGELVDFSTSHLWVELSDLNDDLLPNEMIEFELIFNGWTLSAEAHIHEFSGDQQ